MSRRAREGDALALLERAEDRALAELRRAVAAAGEDLPALGDLRALAQHHPELTVAASAALGAALAPFLSGIARSVLPPLLRSLLRGDVRWLYGRIGR